MWKWENLAIWYQEYFFEVIRNHHEAKKNTYSSWFSALPDLMTDHSLLLVALEELRTAIAVGSTLPARVRSNHLSRVRSQVDGLVKDMAAHMLAQEATIRGLFHDSDKTQDDEGAIVKQIIQSLGLGNRRALP